MTERALSRGTRVVCGSCRLRLRGPAACIPRHLAARRSPDDSRSLRRWAPFRRHPSAAGRHWRIRGSSSPQPTWAGGAEWDPGGAEEPTAESAGLRRRKDL